MNATLPAWAGGILRAEGMRVENGIARFPVPAADESIAFYRSVGGAKFHERSKVAYAMTSLDTPVYHEYLHQLRGDNPDDVIVDVGGGDGRNAVPWLEWGYRRVVVVDVVFAALERLRERIQREHPEWLDRLLLVEADARALPLKDQSAARVIAIEALAYLNEGYEQGLAECARVLAPGGKLLLSDRDYEGGLLARLYYFGGIAGMLENAHSRDLWDGIGDRIVRSRCFTETELVAQVEATRLRILERKGISILAFLISELRSRGLVGAADEARLSEVHALLRALGKNGALRRSHVIVAERPAQA